MTFFEKFLRSELDRDAIFEYIEKWHKNPSGKSLEDYLGMTLAQYHIFLMEPEKVETLRKKYEETGSFMGRIRTKYVTAIKKITTR